MHDLMISGGFMIVNKPLVKKCGLNAAVVFGELYSFARVATRLVLLYQK